METFKLLAAFIVKLPILLTSSEVELMETLDESTDHFFLVLLLTSSEVELMETV